MHRIHWLDQIEETHWVIISSVLRFKKNFHWPENLSRCECLILGRGGRSEYKTHRSKFNIYLHSRADGFDPLLSLHGLAHRNRLPFIRAPTNWVPSNSRILNQCENPMLTKLLTRTCLNIKGLWLPKPCPSPNESLFTSHYKLTERPVVLLNAIFTTLPRPHLANIFLLTSVHILFYLLFPSWSQI